MKVSLGLMIVPAGMVTSLINNRLLQPLASVSGFTVGVKRVPVGVGEPLEVPTTGMNTNPCVADAAGDAGNGNAVLLAVEVMLSV